MTNLPQLQAKLAQLLRYLENERVSIQMPRQEISDGAWTLTWTCKSFNCELYTIDENTVGWVLWDSDDVEPLMYKQAITSIIPREVVSAFRGMLRCTDHDTPQGFYFR